MRQVAGKRVVSLVANEALAAGGVLGALAVAGAATGIAAAGGSSSGSGGSNRSSSNRRGRSRSSGRCGCSRNSRSRRAVFQRLALHGADGDGFDDDIGIDALDFDFRTAVADDAQLVRGGVGKIDDAILHERPSVIDAHDDRFMIGKIRHTRIAGQRQRGVRGSHGVHVIYLAARRSLTIEFLAIP